MTERSSVCKWIGLAGLVKLFGIIGLITVLILSGCSSAKSESANQSSAGSDSRAFDQGSAAAPEYAPAPPGVSDQLSFGMMESPAVPPAGEFGMKMIYTANMAMEVEDYAEAQSEIRNMVALSNGYILQFSDSQSNYERGGNFVIKVPADGFMSFIDQLQQMKTVKPPQLSMRGQDVTEEYVDLSSRLKAKQVTEERLLSFMEKATGTDDLVRFAQELSRVQEEIEQLKGRMHYLDQNVAFSTVDIRLYEKLSDDVKSLQKDDKLPVWERAVQSWQRSLAALSDLFAQLVVVMFAVLPFLIVLCVITVIAFIVYRKWPSKSDAEIEITQAIPATQVKDHAGNPGGAKGNTQGNGQQRDEEDK